MRWNRPALMLLASLSAAAPEPAPSTLPRALAWAEARGHAPLRGWVGRDAEGREQVCVAVSARGVDEEAAGALYKTYTWGLRANGEEPEEGIVLDAPELLRLGAMQTLLGLSRIPLSQFAARALASEAPVGGGRLVSIEPRRWLREPRIRVELAGADGRARVLRFHALSGELLPRGERADFEAWTKDLAPAGFRLARTGGGRLGRWVVRERADAAGGRHVLAQEEDDPTDLRFPVAVLEDVAMRDGTVSVRCRPLTGSVDQAVGLVFRYRDEDNYYVTRANALEGNVRLYYVRRGERVGIASFDGPVAANRWHDYSVTVRGRRIEVSWDGAIVITCEDGTFGEEGAVGVWTKADSVSEFDDLVVAPEG